MPTPSSPSINREWYFLIKTSVLFSFLCVLTIVFSIISFFLWPPFPESIVDIMVSDVFSGIMSLDVLYLIAVLFTLPLVVCLFVLFRESHYSMALFALVIGLIGIVLVVFCRPILEMVTLCREYSRAANEFEKSLFLSSINNTMAYFNGTSYYLHIVFGNISFVMYSFIMLGSKIFNKSTAILGLVTNIISFGILIPVIGPFFGFLFLLGFIPWLVLISLRLLRILRDKAA